MSLTSFFNGNMGLISGHQNRVVISQKAKLSSISYVQLYGIWTFLIHGSEQHIYFKSEPTYVLCPLPMHGARNPSMGSKYQAWYPNDLTTIWHTLLVK
jgi:hypothetical protein